MSSQPCGCDREAHHLCAEDEAEIRKIMKGPRPRVIIESPLGAKTRNGIEFNKGYARAAMRDSLLRGEAPFASHLLYDHLDILDDQIPVERELGMTAGFEWIRMAQKTVVYTDLGISKGMELGIAKAQGLGWEVEYRSISYPARPKGCE